MKIHLPTRCQRDLPPTKDIEAVMGAFCTRVGLDSDGLVLNVTGGDWEHLLAKIGVKIVGFKDNNPHSINVLIGCKNNCVRAYIAYSENNAGVKSNALYERLSPHFVKPNNKFIQLDEEKKKNGAPAPEPPAKAAEGEPGKENPEPSEAKPAPEPSVPAAHKNAAPETEMEHHGLNGSGTTDYKASLKKEAIMHLAVVALVSKFLTTSRVFSFSEFAEVLREDVGIKLADTHMASMGGRFMREGYMIRRNKAPLPARYTLTEKALKYAAETPKPVEETPVKPKREPRAKATPSGEAMPVGDIVAKFSELQRYETEYQTVIKEINRRDQLLGNFKLPTLATEHASIATEITSLETRLSKLKSRQVEIQTIGSQAATFQNELNAYHDTLRTKDLEKKHKEFLEMEKNLNQLQLLLKRG